jgi:hypothetical protein
MTGRKAGFGHDARPSSVILLQVLLKLSLRPFGGSVTTCKESLLVEPIFPIPVSPNLGTVYQPQESNLERSLQDSKWEGIRWVGRQPKPEVLVRPVGLFDDFLEGLEPLGQEVAVLQEDPEPPRGPGLQHSSGDRALPLAEGHVLELGRSHSIRLGKLEDAVRGVRPGREHKDDGRQWPRLRQDLPVTAKTTHSQLLPKKRRS